MSVKDKLLLIEPEHELISIERQCALLQLNRSSWYYHSQYAVGLVDTTAEDIRIMNLIDKIYTKHPFMGIRRITWRLYRDYNELVNHKRTSRLMQLMGIQAIYPAPNTSQKDKQNSVYPYLLRGVRASKPNHIWGVDITYIKVAGCWLYLYAVLDWYSRFVIAWELSDTMEAAFCIATLEKALSTALPQIHNSDQGSQFTSQEYLDVLLAKHTIQISMDSIGRALDNIFTERLWRTVKYEDVYIKDYQSPREARQSLTDYFTFYNYDREHMSLNNLVPAQIYFG